MGKAGRALLEAGAVLLLLLLAGAADAIALKYGDLRVDVDGERRRYLVYFGEGAGAVFESGGFMFFADGTWYVDRKSLTDPSAAPTQPLGANGTAGSLHAAVLAAQQAHSPQLTDVRVLASTATATPAACRAHCNRRAQCTAYTHNSAGGIHSCTLLQGNVPPALRPLPCPGAAACVSGFRDAVWRDLDLDTVQSGEFRDASVGGLEGCQGHRFVYCLGSCHNQQPSSSSGEDESSSEIESSSVESESSSSEENENKNKNNNENNEEPKRVAFVVFVSAQTHGIIFRTEVPDGVEGTAQDVCAPANDTFDHADAPFCRTATVGAPFPYLRRRMTTTLRINLTWWSGLHAQMARADNLTDTPSALYIHLNGNKYRLFVAPAESAHDTVLRVHCSNAPDDDDGGYSNVGNNNNDAEQPLCAVAGGMSGFLGAVPAGGAFSFMLTTGGAFMGPLQNWGAYVQRLAAATRPAAPASSMLRHLGYWTDNDSFYSQTWFVEHANSTLAEALLPVQEWFALMRVPLRYYALTSAWARPYAGAGAVLGCMARYSDYSARLGTTDVGAFMDRLAAKVLLFMPALCATPELNATLGVNTTPELKGADAFYESPVITDHRNERAGRLATPKLDAAEGFWGATLDTLFRGQTPRGNGVILGYTHHYATLHAALVARYHGVADWLDALGRAADARGMAVLLDHVAPLDIVEAALHPGFAGVVAGALVNRLADPLSRTDRGMFALAAALNMSVLTNGLLTTDRAVRPTVRAAVSVLTRGMTGVGDQVLRTDPLVVRALVDASGCLLQPSVPAMPLLGTNGSSPDEDGASPRGQAVYAYSLIGPESNIERTFFQIVLHESFVRPTANDLNSVSSNSAAANADSNNNSNSNNNNNLTFSNSNSDFVALVFDDPACCDNCDADQCLFDPLSVPYARRSEIWHVSPRWRVGAGQYSYALLGEVGKLVPVSPDRFTRVSVVMQRPVVHLKGAPNEVVTVMVAVPLIRPVIRHVQCRLNDDGIGLLDLSTIHSE